MDIALKKVNFKLYVKFWSSKKLDWKSDYTDHSFYGSSDLGLPLLKMLQDDSREAPRHTDDIFICTVHSGVFLSKFAQQLRLQWSLQYCKFLDQIFCTIQIRTILGYF